MSYCSSGYLREIEELLNDGPVPRVHLAVSEAMFAVNPGGARREDPAIVRVATDDLAAAILSGPTIGMAVASVIPVWFPGVSGGQLTRLTYRLIFDLEGGPGEEVRTY